jgi:hypothetical protein
MLLNTIWFICRRLSRQIKKYLILSDPACSHALDSINHESTRSNINKISITLYI